MIIGNPKLKVTRTDIARFLNSESERFPELVELREQYLDKCNRARRLKVSQFGFWVRANKPVVFQRIYRRVSKDMAILQEIYPTCDSTCAP